MPLPRVAHLSTNTTGPRGQAPQAERGAFGAAPESRALRYEKGGAMQSLLWILAMIGYTPTLPSRGW